ncbi:MAG: hypothetical protein OXQ90_11805 [Gammaproteobacteria bacterium]|nr:hypothetical protein [Gammaproteobacteria bacterium]
MTTRRENLPDTELIDIGRDAYAMILYVVMDGWTFAIEQGWVAPDMGEIPITERLRDGMRTVVRDRMRWRMAIRSGTETRSKAGVLNPDGRTDMSVFFPSMFERYDEHDHHAIIECKRVAGDDSTLCREFVKEGVNRFVEGKYSMRHAAGYMVGYVLKGDMEAAWGAINRYLKRNGRSAEQLKPCTVLPAPWTRSSRHPRPPPVPEIDLHHAFLAFRAA